MAPDSPRPWGSFGSANVMHPVGARRIPGLRRPRSQCCRGAVATFDLKKQPSKGTLWSRRVFLFMGAGPGRPQIDTWHWEERRFTILVAKAAFRLEDNYNNSRWPNGRVIILANNCNEMSLLCAVGTFLSPRIKRSQRYSCKRIFTLKMQMDNKSQLWNTSVLNS
jgi:hypothetical protein